MDVTVTLISLNHPWITIQSWVTPCQSICGCDSYSHFPEPSVDNNTVLGYPLSEYPWMSLLLPLKVCKTLELYCSHRHYLNSNPLKHWNFRCHLPSTHIHTRMHLLTSDLSHCWSQEALIFSFIKLFTHLISKPLIVCMARTFDYMYNTF